MRRILNVNELVEILAKHFKRNVIVDSVDGEYRGGSEHFEREHPTGSVWAHSIGLGNILNISIDMDDDEILPEIELTEGCFG